MIKEYGTDEDVTRFLDNYDFHFIPIMNPDGYQHSWDDVNNLTISKSVYSSS